MRLVLFPPDLRVSAQRVVPVDNTIASPSIFTGSVTTTDPTGGGDRLRLGITVQNASNRASIAERGIGASFRSRTRGKANRIYLSPGGTTQRGAFSCPELFVNNSFASTTSWTAGSEFTHTVADRRARLTRNASTATNTLIAQNSASLVQYAPYVARFFVSGSKYGNTLYAEERDSGGTQVTAGTAATTIPGFVSHTFVARNSTGGAGLRESTWAAGLVSAGDYVETQWASLARCALVDNQPNLALHSDDITNAAWTLGSATRTANTSAGADGATTMDTLTDDTTVGVQHRVYQDITVASAASDYCGSFEFKAGTLTHAFVMIMELTGGTGAYMIVNLSTGAVHSSGVTSGTNFTNVRAFTVALGNGIYRCYVVARKANAATSMRLVAGTSNGSSISYTGTGTGTVYVRRGGFGRSGLPFIPAQTTTTSSNGVGATSLRIPLKGLPASTNGLFVDGDYLQIGNHLVMVDGSVNSDAAGCGYLNIAWPLRTTPTDNDAVIANTPMSRFYLVESDTGWDESPGGLANFDFVFEEALDV